MGSYSYCQVQDCGLGLSPATASEIEYGNQPCPLGHENTPNRTMGEVVIELTDTVQNLERLVESLRDAGAD